jgi:hypothetical protein
LGIGGKRRCGIVERDIGHVGGGVGIEIEWIITVYVSASLRRGDLDIAILNFVPLAGVIEICHIIGRVKIVGGIVYIGIYRDVGDVGAHLVCITQPIVVITVL